MIIIPRKAWGARYAAGFGPAPRATELWLHHSATAFPAATDAAEREAMRRLEDIGQQRFGGGISYTFAVAPSGRVYEGTGGLRKGAHTGGRNTIARAIVLIGDHSRVRPSDEQVESVAALVRYGRDAGYWSVDRLSGGHRDAPGAATSCPGNAAYALIPVINSRATTAHLDDDLEDEMNAEDRARLARVEAGLGIVLQQLCGAGATIAEPWPPAERGGGWEHWRYNAAPGRLSLVDLVRSIDRQVNSGLSIADRPNHPGALDNDWGHGMSAHGYLADLAPLLHEMARRLGIDPATINREG